MKINIGTSKGNIVKHNITKPYDDLTFTDIQEIVKKIHGTLDLSIYGWCPSFPQGVAYVLRERTAHNPNWPALIVDVLDGSPKAPENEEQSFMINDIAVGVIIAGQEVYASHIGGFTDEDIERFEEVYNCKFSRVAPSQLSGTTFIFEKI
jgi:hypothetical protein